MKINKLLLSFLLAHFSHSCYSQATDSTKTISHFSGSVSVTHNGISLVPTFSLGKPAAIFNLSIGKGKLSFEPEMRFALEGKPWSFLFWWRYKLLQTEKFKMNLGAHPALNFRTATSTVDGSEMIITRRFLAAEFVPTYMLSDRLNIGIYYLYSYGFEKEVAKHTHFVTLNSTLSEIALPGRSFMRITPQIYYLKQDDRGGTYVSSTINLARKNFPLSAAAILNKRLGGNIIGSKNFNWNTSLVYSFNHQYTRL